MSKLLVSVHYGGTGWGGEVSEVFLNSCTLMKLEIKTNELGAAQMDEQIGELTAAAEDQVQFPAPTWKLTTI